MKSMDRRRFLLATAATAALPTLKSFAQAPTSTATLKLHPGQTGPRIPDNFIGLSYETNELTNPPFFSPEHRPHRPVPRPLAQRRPPHRRQHLRHRLLEAHSLHPRSRHPCPQHRQRRAHLAAPILHHARGHPQPARLPPRHRLDLHLRHQSRHQHPRPRRRRSRVRRQNPRLHPRARQARILPARQRARPLPHPSPRPQNLVSGTLHG